MKRFLSTAGAVLLALGLSFPVKAYVLTENTDAYVVASCGAQAFPLGSFATITQLANGSLCINDSGGGGASTNATIVAPLAGSGSVKTLDDNSAAALTALQTASRAVGAAALATNQISVASTATQIAAARTGAPGTGRAAITIINPPGGVTVYLGNSGATTSTGIPLPAGYSYTLNTTAAVYGIVATGTQTVGYGETY